MELTPLHRLHRTAQQGAIFELDIGIDEQDVLRRSALRARVPAYRRQSAGDDFDVQTIVERSCESGCSIGGIGISNEYFGKRQLRIVLPAQRGQEARQVPALVLRWDNDGKFRRRIHGW